MGFKSRIMSLLLATVLVITSFGSVAIAGSFSDVAADKSYASAISVLSALKLLKGYEDGSFRPEGDITRTEFAAVIVRALGQEDSATASTGKTAFDDVPADFWGSGYINVATSLGIIKGFGDGNFGPDQNVTYEQAVKMTVCALGYEQLAFSLAGNDPEKAWPQGYLAAAAQLNILSGISGVEGAAAKRWQVARLVFNSLETDLMEKIYVGNQESYAITKDKNLLNEKLSAGVDTGTLTANTLASESGALTRAGEIKITNNGASEAEIIKDGGISTVGLVGRSIKYYYTKDIDGEKTLIYIEDRTANSSVIIIDAEDVSKLDAADDDLSEGATLYYWEDKENDSRTKRIDIAKNPTVLINGGVISNPTVDDIVPFSGKIELIASTKGGDFDKIMVTAFETYVVRDISATNKIIYDKFRSSSLENNSLTIDASDSSYIITIKKPDGSKGEFSSIAVNQVLSVKKGKSGSKTTLDITISNRTVSGSISEIIDEDTIAIDKKEYNISAYYQKYYIRGNASNTFDLGDTGIFYLDVDGKIASFEKTASASSNYGYLIAAEIKSSKLYLTLLKHSTTTNLVTDVITVQPSSSFRINGEKLAKEEIVTKLKGILTANTGKINVDSATFPTDYVPQVVLYTLNNSGDCTSISTIGDDLSLYNVTYLPEATAGALNKMQFNSSSNELVGASNTSNNRIKLNSSTQVFIVPHNRADTDEYASKKFDPANPTLIHDAYYHVEAYDMSGTTAKAVVLYETGAPAVSEQSSIGIVTSISQATNSTYEDYDRRVRAYIYTRSANASAESTLYLTENDAQGLNAGDVFIYSLDLKGRVGNVQILLNVDGAMETPVPNPIQLGNVNYSNTKLFGGLVKSVAKESSSITRITFALTNDIDEVESAAIEDVDPASNNAVLVFDGSKTTKVSISELSELNSLDSYEGTSGSSADEVFVIQYGANRTTSKNVFYIIKR